MQTPTKKEHPDPPERWNGRVFIRPGVFQVGKIAKVEVLDELLGVIGSLAPFFHGLGMFLR